MDQDNTHFTPEQVDRQIDEILQRAPLSPDKSLIDDLQHMYQDDERSLEKVWQRLGLQSDAPTRPALIGQEPLHTIQTQKPYNAKVLSFERNQQMYTARKNPIMSKLTLAVAVVVAAIVVGSMIFAFVLSRQSTQVASPLNTQQKTQSAETQPKGIYISDKSKIYRLDTHTNKVLWQQSIQGIIKTVPTSSTVYILQGPLQFNGRKILAIDANSGNQIWSHSFNNLDVTDLVFSNDLLYISTNKIQSGQTQGAPTNSGQIYVLSPNDGSQHATYPKTDVAWSLAAGNGILVVSMGEGLVTYDTNNNKQIWQVSIKGPTNQPTMAMYIVDGIVYATFSTNDEQGGGQSYIAAFRASDGKQIWKSPGFPGVAISRFAIDHKVVYFGTFAAAENDLFKGTAYAFDVQQNKQLWKHDINGGSQGTPVVSNNVVYITSDRGPNNQAYVTALATTTGAVKWQKALKNPFAYTTPSIINGTIYIGNAGERKNGKESPSSLYALKASDGSQLWENAQFDGAPLTIPTE